jgi:hypothetical protein
MTALAVVTTPPVMTAPRVVTERIVVDIISVRG